MAVTWDFKVGAVDVAEKIVSIHATRTDDSTSPSTVNTVSLARACIATPQNKLDALDRLWAKHLAAVANRAAIAAVLSNLEAAGKANFEAREV